MKLLIRPGSVPELVRVKSRNRFRPMLTLLKKEGYERLAVEPQADSADTRIHFLKTL